MFLFLLLSSFLNQASVTFMEPVTFTPAFGPESCGIGGDLLCMGNATSGNGYLDITPDPATVGTNSSLLSYSVGRVLYRQPVVSWPNHFMTTFTISMSTDPNVSTYGDGMAFVMACDHDPSPVDSWGGFLGLFNHTTQGDTISQLAVELDTYKNEWDPCNNHVGIDTNGINSEATACLSNLGVDLIRGAREVKVMIDYDAWTKILQVSVAYAGNPLISVLNHTLKLPPVNPKAVYVGFTGATGSSFERHRILNWAFTAIPMPRNNSGYDENNGGDKNGITKLLFVVIPSIVGALVLGSCTFLVIRKVYRRERRKVSRGDLESRSRNAANAPQKFTFRQLSRGTHNFSKENLLGTGGFGSVYRGNISYPPSVVAVKRISATSKQGEREYLAEICTIGRLRHKNIVQLQGWCHERNHLLLVYEFMSNGSLDRFISKPHHVLEWQTRHKILTGLASALLYLHEESGSTVVHRDVKPNNVMLDADFNAHLGDFGLARLIHNDNSAVTTMLAGTPGYLAPECSYTGRATIESDVFSFGIVVLEVVCGRRSVGGIGDNNLVDWAWGLHGEGNVLEAVDSRLKSRFDEEEVRRALVVGLTCSHPDPTFRPTMRRVVQVFTNPNEPLMELPRLRPSAIYVSVNSSSSSSRTGQMSINANSDFISAGISETSLQYGR